MPPVRQIVGERDLDRAARSDQHHAEVDRVRLDPQSGADAAPREIDVRLRDRAVSTADVRLELEERTDRLGRRLERLEAHSDRLRSAGRERERGRRHVERMCGLGEVFSEHHAGDLERELTRVAHPELARHQQADLHIAEVDGGVGGDLACERVEVGEIRARRKEEEGQHSPHSPSPSQRSAMECNRWSPRPL
jgi:hypothetical protein